MPVTGALDACLWTSKTRCRDFDAASRVTLDYPRRDMCCDAFRTDSGIRALSLDRRAGQLRPDASRTPPSSGGAFSVAGRKKGPAGRVFCWHRGGIFFLPDSVGAGHGPAGSKGGQLVCFICLSDESSRTRRADRRVRTRTHG